MGFFAGKTYFAGTVVSRVVPVPPHLVELWTFAPEKGRRGWPGLDEDGGHGGRDGVGGTVAECVGMVWYGMVWYGMVYLFFHRQYKVISKQN